MVSEIVMDARNVLEVEEFGRLLKHLFDLIAISSEAVEFTRENYSWR